MRKFFLTIVICLGFMYANAQNIGIRAGLNLANAAYQSGGVDLSTDNLTGFQVGIVNETEISSSLFFNTGLLFSQKGLKMNVFGTDVKIPINYLEVPLNLAYKYDLGEAKLFVQAGPYAGIGLSAKAKNGDQEQEIEFGSNDDELKRLDVGLNFGAGVEIEAIQIGVGYGLGLINLENADETSAKNRVLSITATYFFGK